ncbi:MAG: NTP transferase domain-containing protein [Elusimicrobia bacterium]|nr:NTP transferase domain-containing protein [Elusimicrobiota bacterium]
MKAMILAAGQGVRLKPLTDSLPKALVPVAGSPILELVIRKLKASGVTELVINLHHKGDLIEEFLRKKGSFGLGVSFSREDPLLETGGGLKKAAALLGDEDFLVHNADVISTVDLKALMAAHRGSGALATLAVRKRPSSRQLLFDPSGRLAGRKAQGQPPVWAAAPAEAGVELAFDGIHAVSPAIFKLMTETGAFPIMSAYLRLAGGGRRIAGFRSDGSLWAEIGSLEKLQAAGRLVEEKGLDAFLRG